MPLISFCLHSEPSLLCSFPTRRSSDLDPDLRAVRPNEPDLGCPDPVVHACFKRDPASPPDEEERQRRRSRKEQPDRKSTRLNSSHVANSYAVFCLKKKKALMSVNKCTL